MPLYKDIGGAPGVRAALDALYPRVLADSTLSPFFLGVNIEQLKTIQEEFLAEALGGAPRAYRGRPLHAAHARTRQRGADDQVFDHFLKVLHGVLVDLGVPGGTIGDLLAVFEGMRGQILDR